MKAFIAAVVICFASHALAEVPRNLALYWKFRDNEYKDPVMRIPPLITISQLGDVARFENETISQVVSDTELIVEPLDLTKLAKFIEQADAPELLIEKAIEDDPTLDPDLFGDARFVARMKPKLFWVRGVNTKGRVDGGKVKSDSPFVAVDTKRYETPAGTRTVFVLEKTTKDAIERHWLEYRKKNRTK